MILQYWEVAVVSCCETLNQQLSSPVDSSLCSKHEKSIGLFLSFPRTAVFSPCIQQDKHRQESTLASAEEIFIITHTIRTVDAISGAKRCLVFLHHSSAFSHLGYFQSQACLQARLLQLATPPFLYIS